MVVVVDVLVVEVLGQDSSDEESRRGSTGRGGSSSHDVPTEEPCLTVEMEGVGDIDMTLQSVLAGGSPEPGGVGRGRAVGRVIALT